VTRPPDWRARPRAVRAPSSRPAMSCRIDLYNGTRYKWGKTYSDSDKMEWEWPDVVQPCT
jgi:hypothetical protein